MKRGLSRNLDDLGRITIPAEIRKELGINTGDLVIISSDGKKIILEKHVDSCYCCGKDDEKLVEYKGLKICKKCLETVNKFAAIILEEEAK